MKIVNPNNTTHDIKVIPRQELLNVMLELYNEQTQVKEIIPSVFIFTDGYLNLTFVKTFIDGQKFQIKITSDNTVLYRGKLMATTQDPQTFKATKDLYYYE